MEIYSFKNRINIALLEFSSVDDSSMEYEDEIDKNLRDSSLIINYNYLVHKSSFLNPGLSLFDGFFIFSSVVIILKIFFSLSLINEFVTNGSTLIACFD